MRLAPLFLAVALAACSAPRPSGPDASPTTPAVAGLTEGQLDQLQALGVPVLVPDVPGDYRLTVFEVNQYEGAGDYRLSYERADGTCFEVSGVTEGLGGPEWPLVSVETRVSSLPGQPLVRVHEAADDPLATSAQVWGVSTVVSDFIEVGGMNVLFLSDTHDGCRPVSLAEGADLVAGLRPLASAGAAPPPAADSDTFVRADDLLDRYNSGSSPEVAARSIADRYEADEVEIEVLSESNGEATVLVTALGLYDDSVRDERLRLVYRDSGVGTWELVDAGRQVRCWTGRGHEAWSADACL